MKSDLRKISDYIKSKGVKLFLLGDPESASMYIPSMKELSINRLEYKTKDEILAVLVHEAGHMEQTDEDKKHYKIKNFRSVEYAKALLDNEIDAWRRALIIVKKLSLNIDMDYFYKVAHGALFNDEDTDTDTTYISRLKRTMNGGPFYEFEYE